MSELGQQLKSYRLEHQLTQAELAEQLSISQVHVSRIENGAPVSDRLYARLIKLLGGPLADYHLEPTIVQDRSWLYGRFVHPKESSGDYVGINDRAFRRKTVAYHCDAAGSDPVAVQNARQLRTSIEALVAERSGIRISPESVYMSLNRMYGATKDIWRAEPSLNLLFFNKDAGVAYVLNAGMPPIYCYRKAQNRVSPVETFACPPVGDLKKTAMTPYSTQLLLDDGDMLFSFSDGFVEAFERGTSGQIAVHLRAIAVAQRSDAEGVSVKLLRTLSEGLRHRPPQDDMSFMIVSKTSSG